MATLEFSAGTLQRTLTAEPDRMRVLASKLALGLAVAIVGGVAVAAAAGGLANLAANHAGVEIDRGDLAAGLFGQIPEWAANVVIGFGFGLLARSLGGGIAAALAFLLALDGLLTFVPGAADYSFGQLSQDLSNGITGTGETVTASPSPSPASSPGASSSSSPAGCGSSAETSSSRHTRSIKESVPTRPRVADLNSMNVTERNVLGGRDQSRRVPSARTAGESC